MKVIKHGKIQLGVMQITCTNCEAELEVTAKDFQKMKNAPDYLTLLCICCNHHNVFNRKELTPELNRDLNF